jgi:hypothetical protein
MLLGPHLTASEQLATTEHNVANLHGDETCFEIYIFVMKIEQLEIENLLERT